jgi:glucarate dehydratase
VACTPFFAGNLAILTDSSGQTGVGEVPGGETIRQTIEDVRSLLLEERIERRLLNWVGEAFADRDVGGRGVPALRLPWAEFSTGALSEW